MARSVVSKEEAPLQSVRRRASNLVMLDRHQMWDKSSTKPQHLVNLSSRSQRQNPVVMASVWLTFKKARLNNRRIDRTNRPKRRPVYSGGPQDRRPETYLKDSLVPAVQTTIELLLMALLFTGQKDCYVRGK